MNEYSEIVEKWKKLYDCYYYELLPFFVIICHKFYKNKGKGNITAEEMKELILHYKNALNEYKKMLLEIDLKQSPHQKKYVYLQKKIQSEYQRLLQIYDDLLNIEEMKSGTTKNATRKTTKIN